MRRMEKSSSALIVTAAAIADDDEEAWRVDMEEGEGPGRGTRRE